MKSPARDGDSDVGRDSGRSERRPPDPRPPPRPGPRPPGTAARPSPAERTQHYPPRSHHGTATGDAHDEIPQRPELPPPPRRAPRPAPDRPHRPRPARIPPRRAPEPARHRPFRRRRAVASMTDTQRATDRGHHAPGRPTPGGTPARGILMGRPFGVPVYVSPSWFLVAALITWVFGGQLDRVLPELGAVRYLVSLFFAVAFYASVLVHELGPHRRRAALQAAGAPHPAPVLRRRLRDREGGRDPRPRVRARLRRPAALPRPRRPLLPRPCCPSSPARPRRPARRPDDLQPHRRRLQPAARPAPRRRPHAARRRLEDHRQSR